MLGHSSFLANITWLGTGTATGTLWNRSRPFRDQAKIRVERLHPATTSNRNIRRKTNLNKYSKEFLCRLIVHRYVQAFGKLLYRQEAVLIRQSGTFCHQLLLDVKFVHAENDCSTHTRSDDRHARGVSSLTPTPSAASRYRRWTTDMACRYFWRTSSSCSRRTCNRKWEFPARGPSDCVRCVRTVSGPSFPPRSDGTQAEIRSRSMCGTASAFATAVEVCVMECDLELLWVTCRI